MLLLCAIDETVCTVVLNMSSTLNLLMMLDRRDSVLIVGSALDRSLRHAHIRFIVTQSRCVHLVLSFISNEFVAVARPELMSSILLWQNT